MTCALPTVAGLLHHTLLWHKVVLSQVVLNHVSCQMAVVCLADLADPRMVMVLHGVLHWLTGAAAAPLPQQPQHMQMAELCCQL